MHPVLTKIQCRQNKDADVNNHSLQCVQSGVGLSVAFAFWWECAALWGIFLGVSLVWGETLVLVRGTPHT